MAGSRKAIAPTFLPCRLFRRLSKQQSADHRDVGRNAVSVREDASGNIYGMTNKVRDGGASARGAFDVTTQMLFEEKRRAGENFGNHGSSVSSFCPIQSISACWPDSIFPQSSLTCASLSAALRHMRIALE